MRPSCGNRIDDERLSWQEFDALVETLLAEAAGALGDEELPWPPDEAIETRLDALKIDWLVEKFKELPAPLRTKFLQMVMGKDEGHAAKA